MIHQIHARTNAFPATTSEIIAVEQILATHAVCVATVQRKLRIGWNRAADLIAQVKGVDALPDVAKRLF